MKPLDKKTLLGFIIIGICLTVFLALAASAVVLKQNAHDPETFCSKTLTAHTIIVLDKTDSLNNNQQRFVMNFMNTRMDKLMPDEKLSIFLLTEHTCIAPEPIFSKCNPGNGETANPLYQNPQKIKTRFDDLFAGPLQKAVEQSLSDNIDSQSPILEMIRELSLRDDFNETVPNRTLIIISDMMHHTANYSHYRNSMNYQMFLKRSYADEVMSDLHSVDVQFVYLLRNRLGRLQGKRHLLFWEEYLHAMGADLTTVRNVR